MLHLLASDVAINFLERNFAHCLISQRGILRTGTPACPTSHLRLRPTRTSVRILMPLAAGRNAGTTCRGLASAYRDGTSRVGACCGCARSFSFVFSGCAVGDDCANNILHVTDSVVCNYQPVMHQCASVFRPRGILATGSAGDAGGNTGGGGNMAAVMLAMLAQQCGGGNSRATVVRRG